MDVIQEIDKTLETFAELMRSEKVDPDAILGSLRL